MAEVLPFQSYVRQKSRSIEVSEFIFLLRWAILLTAEIDVADLQLHYVQICFKVCLFGEFNYNYVPSKITS